MDTDAFFMEQALSLGERSRPFAGINPPVGAVLVRNGAIIGRGFHKGPGTPHAEVVAMHDARRSLSDAGQSFGGTTLYCTLEPCCHCGAGKRTPPCTEAIIAAGVSRVVFASRDPNPRVAGKGAERLRAAGIRVEAGLLAEKADALIESFSVSIRLRRPFIHLKWAQSLDGRLACRSGASRWITNSHARAAAHALRARHDAIMVGAGTLRADDPALTVRDAPLGPDPGALQPLRVVLAGRSPLPGRRSPVFSLHAGPDPGAGRPRRPRSRAVPFFGAPLARSRGGHRRLARPRRLPSRPVWGGDRLASRGGRSGAPQRACRALALGRAHGLYGAAHSRRRHFADRRPWSHFPRAGNRA